MKKTIFLFVAVLLSTMTYGQTANGFNFKALVTNNGTPVASSIITVRVTFKAGSSVKWKETHSNVHTDANGIFSVIMGEGTRVAGVTSFDKVNWNVGNMNYTVEVDTGSGYQALVSNEYFKRVPYAKMAERLGESSYNIVTNEKNIWAKNDGNGHLSQGFRLSNGGDDWYIYMKADKGFTINNDGSDVFGIDDTNSKAWFKGSLDLPSTGILFRDPSSGYTNSFSLKVLSDGLTFKYNNGVVMKMHGSASVEVMKKLRAPASGDSDMKAYIYGKVYSGGTTPNTPTPNTDGFSVQKLSTGKYKITFTTAMSSLNNYITIATIYGPSIGMVRTDSYSGFVYVYTYNASGTLADRSFQFVVYKK